MNQALAQDHDVTVVVRDPIRLAIEHAKLRAMQANVFDPVSVKPVLGEERT